MNKKIIGFYRNCDILTLTGTTFGAIGMILAINKLVPYAVICLILCGICDAFDGFLARRRKNTPQESYYGGELDSLSDAICFGVFPAIISICDGVTGIFAYFCYVFYILAGVIRLAYFNTLAQYPEKATHKNFFIGLPITTGAIFYPITWFLLRKLNVPFSNIIVPCLFLLFGLLYILHFKFPKLTNKARVILSIMGVLFIITFIVISILGGIK